MAQVRPPAGPVAQGAGPWVRRTPKKYRMLKCVVFGLDYFFLTKGSIVRDLVVTTLLIAEGPPFIKSQGRGDRLSMFW